MFVEIILRYFLEPQRGSISIRNYNTLKTIDKTIKKTADKHLRVVSRIYKQKLLKILTQYF